MRISIFAFTSKNPLSVGLFILGFLVFGSLSVSAQTGQPDNTSVSTNAQPATKTAVASPAIADLRGVTIGMTDEQVREKLGRPQAGDASGLYYSFSNGESLQLALDGDKKVRMVAAIYSGKDAKAPDVDDIFGSDITAQPSTDGKIYKMVRYPSAGYWVSYSRLNLDAGPMTTVTIQKMDVH